MGEGARRHTSQATRKVTIRDVAAAAGVSHQTVANVLKTPDRVAPDTRRLVNEHIERLGFRPNRLAQNLSSRRTRLIGFRASTNSALASGGILDAFLQAIAEAAEALDHHVVLFHSAPGVAEVRKAEQIFAESVADAFIVAETDPGDPRIAEFAKAGLTFVTFGRTDGAVEHHWVDTDNVLGGRLATRHLIELGHRNIAFVGWPEGSLVGDDRARGWADELAWHQLDCTPEWRRTVTNDRNQASADTQALLAAHPSITAIVAASDEIALGVQMAADATGREISVVGYDDSLLASVGAGITTLHQPLDEIARQIIALIVRLSAGEDVPTVHQRVAPRLVVRGSTKPVAAPSPPHGAATGTHHSIKEQQ
jgi:LacI family transcriptional regulator